MYCVNERAGICARGNDGWQVVKKSGHHFGGVKILAGETEGTNAASDEGTLFRSAPANLTILHEDDQAERTDVSRLRIPAPRRTGRVVGGMQIPEVGYRCAPGASRAPG